MTGNFNADEARALVERLRGVVITAVRANRDLMVTSPVTQAQSDAREAADTIAALLDVRELLMDRLLKDEAFLRRLAQGYDREDAAQMGEQSPWVVDPSDDDEEWKLERIACAAAGLRNAFLAGETDQ